MHNCTTAQLPYPRYPRSKCSSQTAPHALIHPWIHGIDSIPSTIHTSLKSAMPWAPKADPSALPIRPSALYLLTYSTPPSPPFPTLICPLPANRCINKTSEVHVPIYKTMAPLSYLPTISLLSLRPACLGWRRIHPALSVCCASSARRVIGCQDWTSWDECGESAREGEVGAGA
jgi:hypothetical protein